MFDPVELRKNEVEVLLEQFQSDSDENFVTAVYKIFLTRIPDPPSLPHWIACAALNRRQVIIGIMNSLEYLKSSGYFLSLLDKADELIENKEWKLAEEALLIIYEQYTHSPEISTKIGLSCWRQDKFKLAFDYYHQAYQELPNEPGILLALVQLLFILKEDSQALKLLSRFIAFNPKSSTALAIAGKIYQLAQRMGDSNQLLQAASRGQDYSQELWEEINQWESSLKYYHNQKASESIESRFSKSISEFEVDIGNTVLGFFLQIGDPEQTVQLLEEQLKNCPEDFKSKISLAFHYYLLRNLERSESLYREVLKKEPKNQEALSGLIYVFEELGKYYELKKTSEKLLFLDQNSEIAKERLILSNKKLSLEPGHRLSLAEIEDEKQHIEYLDGWYEEEIFREETFRWSKKNASFRLIIPPGSDLNKKTLCLRTCEQGWAQRKVVVKYEDGRTEIFYTKFYPMFIHKIPYDQKSKVIVLEVQSFCSEESKGRDVGISLADAYLNDDDPYYCELLPKDLVIESSTICNLRCVMCPHSLEPESKATLQSRDKFLDKDIYKKLVRLVKQGERIQLHSIGEPLLSEMFWKLLEIVPEEAQISSVNTNFLVADEAKMEKILNSNLKYIRISVDAAKEDTYRKIRRSEIGKLKEKIKLLVKKRNERKAKLRIIVNMTLMKENIDELVDFVKMAYFELGCDSVETWPLNNVGPEAHKLYRKNYDGWIFDYEEQGPWNFKEYYNQKIDEAIEFGKKHSTKFGYLKYE